MCRFLAEGVYELGDTFLLVSFLFLPWNLAGTPI